MSFEVGSLAGKPNSSTLIATEKVVKPSAAASSSADVDPSASSTAFVIHAPVASTSSTTSTPSLAKCTPRQLPFAVAQSLWLSSSTAASSTKDDLSLAVVSASTGEVSLLGSAARVGSAVLPTRLPSAVGKGQSRLFDEIFGSESDATKVRKAEVQSSDSKGKSKLGEGLEVLEMPAHSLPPVRLLWRSMLGGFKVAPMEEVEKDKSEKMDVEEEGATVETKEASEVSFAPSEQDKLADIFRQRLVIGKSYLSFSLGLRS